MELIERIALDKINYLNSLTFTQYKPYCKSSCKNEEDRKTQFNIMKSFCQTNLKTRGETKRIYSYTLTTPHDVGGRLYCGNSIQGLSSIIRGFLLGETTTDIDMKNAHPVILRYLCKLNKIDCPNLAYYIENRDEILIGFDGDGKTEFLKCVNDSKPSKKYLKNKFFKDFDKECKDIQKQITSLECYNHIVITVPSNKNYNWYGSAINRILCVYENKILQEALSILNQKHIEIGVLMFDGIMPYGNFYNDDQLLYEITQFVETKFEGLNMKWSYKEHKTGIILMPEVLEVATSKQQMLAEQNASIEQRKTENVFVDNDNDACDFIFKNLKDTIIFVNNRFYYKYNNCWINDMNKINSLLLVFINESNIYRMNKNFDLLSYGQYTKAAKNIMELLYAKVAIRCNTKIKYSMFHSSTKNKICFLDGVLDFKNKSFTLWENLIEPTYTTIIIERNYSLYFENPDRGFIDKIKYDIFANLFGAKTQLALNFFSRAIAGNAEDKNFMSYMGNRNCGKGILFSTLYYAFQNYIASFSLDNFTCRRESNKSSDIAKENAHLIPFEYARIAISQETDENENNDIKEGHKISNKKMKSVMSGGDEVEVRPLYSNPYKITLDATLCSFGNNELVLSGEDGNQHHLKFNGVKQFITQDKYDSYQNMGDVFLSSFAVRDETLKDKIKSEDYMNAMVYLMYENYEDKCITVDGVENDDGEMVELSIRALIFKHFEITKSDKDRVAKDDLFALISKDKKKITNELKQLGCVGSKDCKMTIVIKDENGNDKNERVQAFQKIKLRE